MSTAFTPASQSVLVAENERYFTFFQVILTLIAVTFIELVIIIMPFHNLLLFWSLTVLSLVKFFAVIIYFMHLRWDKILCTLFFLGGLVIATGTVAALMALFEPGSSLIDGEPFELTIPVEHHDDAAEGEAHGTDGNGHSTKKTGDKPEATDGSH